MARFDGWDREELVWHIFKLEREIEDLKDKNRRLDDELSSAQFKIRNELEPRISAEKRAYDNWVTNPERR